MSVEYHTSSFSFINNPKNLEPSYESRSFGLFWKGKIHFTAKFHRTDLVICSHTREGKTPSCVQINIVAFTEFSNSILTIGSLILLC